jgi:hypothetical protein
MPAVLRAPAAAVLFFISFSQPFIARPAIVHPADPSAVTLPFTVDHNRMIVDLEFLRPDGSLRAARAWVDTGSEYLTLSETLARDLGIDVSGLTGDGHSVELASPAPPVRVAGLPLRVDGVRTRVGSGAFAWAGIPAEANLPASLLRHDHVIFDYPARRLTVARPGVLQPRGVGVPCRVNAETGLFMVEASIDGRAVALGVDNGSAGTWVSDTLTTAWRTRHADWPHAIGAAGSANFFGFPFEARGVLMRLPAIAIGSVRAQDVATLGLPQDLFDWYSKKSAGAVLGFIGANVLRSFRLEVDFANRMTYWEAGPSAEPHDLDIVGLTLHPEADATFTIAGVVTHGGKPAVEGVQPGDKLIRVDDLRCADATMGAVVSALRGTPGSTRTLVIERAGRPLTVRATVLRLP